MSKSDISILFDDQDNDSNDVTNLEKIGCEHYSTRCKIICPVCNNNYVCRFCHDEIENAYDLPLDKQHEIDRYKIKEVICIECDIKQPISNECQNCNIKFAEYYCNKCNLYDDDGINKGIYHCDSCKVCRISNGQEFYHCDGCNTCISSVFKDDPNHKCNDLTDEVCPVCNEVFLTTRKGMFQLTCNHWIHSDCFKDMLQHGNFMCPFCSKTMVDLSEYYKIIDQHVTSTTMPDEYNKQVSILCNECVKTNDVPFHFYGMKCPECGSYNTKQIG